MKIAIFGFGNLGKGVLNSVKQNPDIELFGIFTRRDPDSLKVAGVNVYSASDVLNYKNDIDVMIICGGSATDLPKMTPYLAEHFNVIDSFDTHADIPKHFENVNTAAQKNGHTAIISVGWDPGMFSLNRLYAQAILPCGSDYTFWGKGVSQGHSDAIRRIEGVIDARQYTVPVKEALDSVRAGDNPTLTTRQKHTRECFVVAEEGADLDRIEREIKEMPKYFADYDTTVNFITLDELLENHSGIPHGGCVIRTGVTGDGNKHVIEYSLKLDSNPEFTANVLTAYARAAYRMNQRGVYGCKTVFDVAPSDIAVADPLDLYKHIL